MLKNRINAAALADSSDARALAIGNPLISSSMIVPVRGVNYRISVVPGPLLVRGETTASRVRHGERIIEVDDVIPAGDRWRVAALAVAYACNGIEAAKFQPVRVLGAVD